MTLQKFSDKNFISMFKNKLKQAMPFTAIGLITMLMFAVVTPFTEITGISYRYDSILFQQENIRYILFGQISAIDYTYSDYAVFMYFVLIMASILCAIMVFKDLSSKKTANVYYSLGFSRNKLFGATYLSGAVCVLAMTVIPFTLSFIMNALVFGLSKELITALIFIVSVFCNVSLLAYTLGSIGMILSGMFYEGAFFAFFLNSVSAIFSCATCLFSEGLLTGGGFLDRDYYYYYSSFGESFYSAFFGKTSFLNSLSHSVYEVGSFATCLYNYFDVEYAGNTYRTIFNWETPKFIPLLVWSFILAGLVCLAFYAFNKKKAENIGFFASSKVLYRILFGTIVVAISSLGCESYSIRTDSTKGITWLFILISLAISLVLITILTLIFTKLSKMKFRHEFRFFGIYALAVIGFAVIFSTGFFGYTNRIPDVEKVKSVSISGYSLEPSVIYLNDGNGDYSKPLPISDFIAETNYNFTNKSEIAEIQSIHKDLIAADNVKISTDYKNTKLSTVIIIEYELVNGKTITRYYRRTTPQIIEKYVTSSGISGEIKAGMIDKLTNAVTESKETLRYTTVFSPDLTRATNVELTDEQLNSLLEAYSKDIKSLPIRKILMPTSKNIGVIAIREDYNVVHEYDDDGYEIIAGKSSELEYSSLLVYSGECDYIAVTEDMVNCIEWAKKAGVYKYFAIDYKTEISTIDAIYNNAPIYKATIASDYRVNLLFNANSYRFGDSYGYDEYGDSTTIDVPLSGSSKLSGLTEEEVRYIRENAYTTYLTTQTGYFIEITTDEENPLNVTLFIPESKLTPELKVKFAAAAEIYEESDYMVSLTDETTHSVSTTERVLEEIE